MHHYRISGWTLEAEMALPHLFPCPAPETPPDIRLRLGAVPPPLAPLRLERDMVAVGADGAVVIDAPGCVRIAITDGRNVVVDPAPGAALAEVQSWLLGPGLGVICHQRGAIPLHACAIGTLGGAGALAIAGHSGAGKSTTAAALVRRGHRLLGDDVLVIDPDTALAQPCFPVVRLWDRSRAALEIGQEGHQPVARKAGKWHVPMPAAFDPMPRPLTAIVHLRTDPAAHRPALTRCAPAHAAAVLDAMTYRVYLAEALHGRLRVLRAAAGLAQRVPVWQMVRTTDFADLPEMLDMLEGLAMA